MANYMICDADGNQLTDGVSEHEYERMAQEFANERGEVVSAYPSDSDEEIIFKPRKS